MGYLPLTLKLMILPIIAFALSACSSNEQFDSKSKGINTLNIFFSEIEVESDDNVMGIYSYNEDKNRTTLRAQHDLGENKAFTLNTSFKLQGYEYLAYVSKDPNDDEVTNVYVLNYDKDASTRIRQIWSTNLDICGIYPVKEASTQVYGTTNHFNQLMQFRFEMEVSLQADDLTPCSPDTNNTIRIDYRGDPEFSQISTPIREFAVDYTFGERGSVFDTNTTGRFGYLVDNQNGTLSLLGEDQTLEWSANLPTGANSASAVQYSRNRMLLQTGDEIHVIDSDSMFDLNEFDQNGSPNTISDQLLGEAEHVLEEHVDLSLVPHDSNGNQIVFRDGDSLYLVRDNDATLVYELPDAADNMSFRLFSNNIVLVKLYYDGYVSLVIVENVAEEWVSSQRLVLGLPAERLHFSFDENSVYVSTFNLGLGDAGWQAHYYSELDQPAETYDDAMFLSAERADKNDDRIFLLSSEMASDPALVDPSLFRFDPETPEGKAFRKDSGGSVVRRNGDPVPVEYGQILGNISYAPTGIIEVVNDIYANFALVDDEDVERHFYLRAGNNSGSLNQMLP